MVVVNYWNTDEHLKDKPENYKIDSMQKHYAVADHDTGHPQKGEKRKRGG